MEGSAFALDITCTEVSRLLFALDVVGRDNRNGGDGGDGGDGEVDGN